MQMELTPREREIIPEHRRSTREIAEKESAKLIGVAHRFSQWLMETGAGATYSTFCNDFGYQADASEDRSRTYKLVETIRECAYRLIAGDE